MKLPTKRLPCLLLLVHFLFHASHVSAQSSSRKTEKDAEATTLVTVVRVIDGDTIEVCCVGGKHEKVRYIGIESLETNRPTKGIEPLGKVASEANRKLVERKTVRLEFDVQRRDQYGKLLAYVYLEDGTFVNAWLVEQGYAQAIPMPPNVKHQDLFLKLQREASDARRGLWGK